MLTKNLKEQAAPSVLAIFAAFFAVYVIWGSTYLAIRLAVEHIPHFLLAGIRFFIGGIMFYAWALWRGQAHPSKREWLASLKVGILMIVTGAGFVHWAEKTVPSGLTALLVATVPLWITLFDWLRPAGVKPSNMVMFGLVLGFLGVATLMNPFRDVELTNIDLFGAGLIMISTISWSLGSIYSRHVPHPNSQSLYTGMQMLAGGSALLILGYFNGETTNFQLWEVPLKSSLALWYLTFIGGLAYAAYTWLLKVTTPAKASTYAYVNPAIALLLGYLVGDGEFTMHTFGCSLLILLAVVIIVSRKRPKTILPRETK